MRNMHPVFDNIFRTSMPVLYETMPAGAYDQVELGYAEGELTLIPASSNMACEECGSHQTLTERSYSDEDGETYDNVLCGSCRAREVL